MFPVLFFRREIVDRDLPVKSPSNYWLHGGFDSHSSDTPHLSSK